MATIEEVVVKFTGDATGLEKAGSDARAQMKSLEREILLLNEVNERARKQGSPDAVRYNTQALEGKINKYLSLQEKVLRAEEKDAARAARAAKQGQGESKSLGRGDIIQGNLIAQAFTSITNILRPAISKLIEDFSGLSKSARDFNTQMERSNKLQQDDLRRLGDRDRAVDRRVSMMVNPYTGEQDVERQIIERQRQQKGLQDEMAEQQKTIDNLIKARDDLDGAMKEIPVIGRAEQMAFDKAVQDVEQAKQKYDALKSAAHGAGEAIKDLQKLGDLQTRHDREDRIKTFSLLQSQRQQLAGFGRDPAEAFILGQKAIGRNVDEDMAGDLLRNQDKLTGKGLEEKYMDPYRRAGKEIDKLNRLYRDGTISAVTYSKALADVAKQTDGVGRASERAAVEVGSAESLARIDEYLMVQRQPEALTNQVERAMNQPPAGFVDPETKKQTEILEGIRANTKPKNNGAPMAPANIGGA